MAPGAQTLKLETAFLLLMITTISQLGNSVGIVLDDALLQEAHMGVGDQVKVEVHFGGAITIVPVKAGPSREEISALIEDTMTQYARTMRRLA